MNPTIAPPGPSAAPAPPVSSTAQPAATDLSDEVKMLKLKQIADNWGYGGALEQVAVQVFGPEQAPAILRAIKATRVR